VIVLKYLRAAVLSFLVLVLCVGPFVPSSFAKIDPNVIVKDDIPLFDLNKPFKVNLSNTVVMNKGWSVTTGIDFYKQAVVGVDGTIYVSTSDRNKAAGESSTILMAYSPFGSQLWTFEYEEAVQSEPFLGPDNAIYVGVMPNKLLKINKNGKLEKTFTLKYSPKRFFGFGADGSFYYSNEVETQDGLLVSFDPGLERINWTRTNIYPYEMKFGRDGTIYCLTFDLKSVLALRGEVVSWRVTIPYKINQFKIGADGSVYTFSYVLNQIKGGVPGSWVMNRINSSGKFERTFNFGENYDDLGMVEVGNNGAIYFTSKNLLVSLNSSFETRWKLDFGDKRQMMIGSSGMIYVYNRAGKIVALSDGSVQWSASVDITSNVFLFLTEGPEGNLDIVMPNKLNAVITHKIVDMTMNKSSLSLHAGQSESLFTTVAPYKTPFPYVKWSSDDPAIASVNQEGQVTGIAPGQAQITATTLDGAISASTTVNVATVASSPEISKFSDVEGHKYMSFIFKAADLDIANGYPDGTFKPEGQITRAEFTVMLTRALKPVATGQTLTFKDKNKIGAWAESFIAQAVQIGVINGYSDGTFRPSENVTHVEMVSMIMRSSGLSLTDLTERSGYDDDADIPRWGRAAVSAAEKNGIIEVSESNGKFAPSKLSTRAEAVTIIVRLLEWIKK